MEFALLASAHFLALLSPGPDFFLIMQASLRLPLRYGFAICAGIALANGAYLFIALIGFEVVRESGWIFSLLKYLGAVYLLFLGVMLLRHPRQTFDTQTDNSFMQTRCIWYQFFIGFMSAILNPKNMIFYLSLFTAMVSTDTTLYIRIFYAIWMMLVVFFWDCFVVITIGRETIKKRLGYSIYYIEKLSGAALALFGIFLPFA